MVSVYLRLRRASGTERQQIEWLVYSAALLGSVVVVGVVGDQFSGWFGPWISLLVILAFLCLPVSIGVAVLRFRLYEIDIMINRTLVYGPLTPTLLAIYFGRVAGIQFAFRTLTGQEQEPRLAIVVSTLAIAALFNPLRRRVQSFIDRRFYRRKYDAARTLEEFSAKLRDETDMEALGSELPMFVRDTMQPEHVSLWLRPALRHRLPGRRA